MHCKIIIIITICIRYRAQFLMYELTPLDSYTHCLMQQSFTKLCNSNVLRGTFAAILSGTKGLVLALCSGVPLGDTLGTLWDTEDWSWCLVSCAIFSVHSCYRYFCFWSHPVVHRTCSWFRTPGSLMGLLENRMQRWGLSLGHCVKANALLTVLSLLKTN